MGAAHDAAAPAPLVERLRVVHLKMVDAVLDGKPTVILTPMAKIGARVHALAPSTTVRLMGLANRLLPKAPGTAGQSENVPGHVADRRADSPLLERLITLGQKAAQRNNET